MKTTIYFLYCFEESVGNSSDQFEVIVRVGSESVRYGTVIWSLGTRMWNAEKSGQSHRGYRNLFGCEIRICPENPDVKCEEIRAIATGISKFVRMRNPDLSGKSGCEMRRNPGNHIGDIEICPDAKSGSVRKKRMWTGCDCADLSKKSGCEMWRNSGNHHRDLRKNPDAKWVKIRICLLRLYRMWLRGFFKKIRMWDAEKSGQSPRRSPKKSGCGMGRNPDLLACCCLLNKVLEHFQICDDGFLRMFDAEKSGQSPAWYQNLSGCEFEICPDGIYGK